MTNYLEDALLNHVLRNTPYTSPVTVYVGLYTTSPGEPGGGVEVSGGGYARQAITFDAPSGGACNNQLVTFPTASADWGLVVAFAVLDGSGNILLYANLTASKNVYNGDTARFSAGTLIVGMD